jgi:protein SCO1/2
MPQTRMAQVPEATAPTTQKPANTPAAAWPRRPHLPSKLVMALAAALVSGVLVAAVAWAVWGSSLTAERFNGAELSPAQELPALTLKRADGMPFTTADTAGRISLFFFGYTLCPDVCPMTLGQVAKVRRELGADAQYVDIYFVTVDPERDTPERLAQYAARFDPAIIPLTGTPEELEQARAAFGALAQKRPVPDSSVGYLMDHTATLHLVDPDRRIRLLYSYTTAPGQIAADIRRLLPQVKERASALAIESAWARAAGRTGTSAVYLVIRNHSSQDDALLGARSDVAETVEVHRSFMDQGMMRMEPAGRVVVPARGTLTLEPGGLHIMLIGLRRDLTEGTHLTVTLQFERAGPITVQVPVRAAAGMSGGHSASGMTGGHGR